MKNKIIIGRLQKLDTLEWNFVTKSYLRTLTPFTVDQVFQILYDEDWEFLTQPNDNCWLFKQEKQPAKTVLSD